MCESAVHPNIWNGFVCLYFFLIGFNIFDISTHRGEPTTKAKEYILKKLRSAAKMTLVWKKKAMQRKLVINNLKRQVRRQTNTIANLRALVNVYKLDCKISKKAAIELKVEIK